MTRANHTEEPTEQDVQKAFDDETSAAQPMLNTREITDTLAGYFDIEVSTETVRSRLREMEDRLQARNLARRLWARLHSLGRDFPTTC